jgi:type II secretory pathway component PulJ
MTNFEAISITLMLFASCGLAYFAGYVSAIQDEQQRRRKAQR